MQDPIQNDDATGSSPIGELKRSQVRRGRMAVGVTLVLCALGLAWVVGLRPGREAAWRRDLRARGERLSVAELVSGMSTGGTEIIEVLARELAALEGFSGAVHRSDGPGALFGAQPSGRLRSNREVFHSFQGVSMTWEVAQESMRERAPHYRQIHRALEQPPLFPVFDVSRTPPADRSGLNLADKRRMAQRLGDAVVVSLHASDREAAGAHLRALLAMLRLHREDPTLVGQMMRSSILEMALELVWEALIVGGWSETDLAMWQGDLEEVDGVSRLVRSFETERAASLDLAAAIREGTTSFGAVFSGVQAGGWRQVRDRFLELAWRRLWLSADEGLMAEYMQSVIDDTRTVVRELNVGRFPDHQAARDRVLRRAERRPWRYRLTAAAIPNAQRALESAVRRDSYRRLAVIALAVERHRLRLGRMPALERDLVPGLLREIPRDWGDGRPVRWSVGPGGSLRAYSVGLDGRDQGGDPVADWVWPLPPAPAR